MSVPEKKAVVVVVTIKIAVGLVFGGTRKLAGHTLLEVFSVATTMMMMTGLSFLLLVLLLLLLCLLELPRDFRASRWNLLS
jgi:hypothetical protein